MGNIFCCRQKSQQKKLSIIPSIRTTTSLQQHIPIQLSIDLQSQFRQIYQDQLLFLQECFSFQPNSITNINIEILELVGKTSNYEIFLGKTDFQTDHQEMFMKVISKSILNTSARRKSIAMQNLILQYHDCPFLIKSLKSKQDQNSIYYFFPVLQGNSLISFTLDSTNKGMQFNANLQDCVKFVIAGLILSLEYVHNKLEIILNDLKLQHIWIDNQGYPIITDFGSIQPEKAKYHHQFTGSTAYLCPEKVNHQSYTKSTDLWSLGVLIYILYFKQLPFEQEVIENRALFIEQIKKKEGKLKKMSPKGSEQLKDLINCLIRLNPRQRLGAGNFDELKNHAFFSNIDWANYQNRNLQSPLKSIIQHNPLKKLTNSQNSLRISKFKVFRNQSQVQNNYLYNLLQKQSWKLFKSSIFMTKQRKTRPFTANSLENSSYLSAGLFDSCKNDQEDPISDEFMKNLQSEETKQQQKC